MMSATAAAGPGPITPDARDRILDAAEAEFARLGYAGAAMKVVAAGADVAQGLLHYHFGGKERLYEAVIQRRSVLINDARRAALDRVDPGAPDAVEDVFRAFFAPPLGPEGGGAAYARIFAALAVGRERDRVLIERYYDPTAQRFIAAIRAAAPRADEGVAAWAYLLALGALVPVVGRDERLDRLSKGAATFGDADAIVERLVAFSAGGLRGLIGADEEKNKA